MIESLVRNTLVDALHQAHEFVSGEQISNKLAISRTAVWKHIQTLKREGYHIETVRRKGYKLLSAPKDIYPLEIRRLLRTKHLGRNLIFFPELDSTNNRALKIVHTNNNIKDGTLLLAQIQRGGRGRRDRSWLSLHGGIWATLILKPDIKVSSAYLLTFAAAVAICKSIRNLTNLPAMVKWPNDVECKGRKLAGVLGEIEASAGKIDHVVLGFGINGNIRLSKFPQPLRSQATSLYRELRKDFCLNELLADILLNMEKYYEMLKNYQEAQVLDLWREYNNTLGHQISVTLPDKSTIQGLAQDISSNGALQIKDAAGKLHQLVCGDISIRNLD